MTMEELLQKLTKLKGILLLDVKGNVYLLRSFADGRGIVQSNWFTRKKVEVQYIKHIEFSNDIVHKFKPSIKLDEVNRVINEMIRDRRRYLNLQKSLKSIGCAITTRRF